MSTRRSPTGAERSDRALGYFVVKPFGPVPDYGVILWVALGFALASLAASNFPEHFGVPRASSYGFRGSTFPPEGWFVIGPSLFAAAMTGFAMRFAFDWGLGKHCLTLATLALMPAQYVMLAVPSAGGVWTAVLSALILGPLLAWLTLREETVWPGVGMHYIANAALALILLA